MRIVRLGSDASAFERGARHGAELARSIGEIARMRSELACSTGSFRSDRELLRVAGRHVPILQAYDSALCDELRGIAAGSGQSLERIVVLNHYTDLKDLDARVEATEESEAQASEDD